MSDHFNPATIKRLHKERPSLRFACAPWLAGALVDIGVNRMKIDVMNPGDEYNYAIGITAKCVEIPHDVPNCAWDIVVGGSSVFYATDCGTLAGIEAPERDLYLVEGNYEEAELHRRMAEKMAVGEFSYEQRVESTHLSVEQALRFLSENAGDQSKYVLVHQHK